MSKSVQQRATVIAKTGRYKCVSLEFVRFSNGLHISPTRRTHARTKRERQTRVQTRAQSSITRNQIQHTQKQKRTYKTGSIVSCFARQSTDGVCDSGERFRGRSFTQVRDRKGNMRYKKRILNLMKYRCSSIR